MGLHSVPPPPPTLRSPGPGIVACRRPQLAERNPRLFAAGVAAANALDVWMRRRGVSNDELAERWGISESIVRDLRTRQKPLHMAHVLALPLSACNGLLDVLREVRRDMGNEAA
jgi:hypothetical protein